MKKIEENKISHKCSTDSGSSGAPILLVKNNKVIGVHYGGSKHSFNFNFGTLLLKPIIEFLKEYKNISKNLSKENNNQKVNNKMQNDFFQNFNSLNINEYIII